MLIKWMLGRMFLFAADDAGSGGGSGSDDGAGSGDGKGTDDAGAGNGIGDAGSGEKGKTFTQEDVDRILSDRLKRERKSWEKQLEDEKRKAAMDEGERLKAEKEELDAKLKAMEAERDSERITLQAQLTALRAGVKPENIEAVLKLGADELATVEVTDGKPDAQAIARVVDEVLKKYPLFKTAGGPGPGDAGDKDDGKGTPLSLDTLGRMSPEELKRRMPEIQAHYADKK